MTDTVSIWHHDCSNLTAFDGIGDDSWLWIGARPMTTSSGSLNSSGRAIYCPELGPLPNTTGWYGPLYYHTLSVPFSFPTLRKLKVEFELAPNSPAEIGGAQVTLHDETNASIVALRVSDPYMGDSEAHPRAILFFSNGTVSQVPPYLPSAHTASPYHEITNIEMNSSGLYKNLPRICSMKMLDVADVEERTVTYISVWIASAFETGYEPFPFTDIVRIHDIALSWSGCRFGQRSSL